MAVQLGDGSAIRAIDEWRVAEATSRRRKTAGGAHTWRKTAEALT
jgi:hypothetical protein